MYAARLLVATISADNYHGIQPEHDAQKDSAAAQQSTSGVASQITN
jgi:hypothetical protein